MPPMDDIEVIVLRFKTVFITFVVNVVDDVVHVAEEGKIIPSPSQHDRAIQGTTQNNVTGRARQTTYNERTHAISEAAKKKAADIAALKRLGVVTGESADLSKYGNVASTPSGILVEAKAAEDFANSTANAAKPAQIAEEASPLWKYARHLASLPVKGALTGAGIVGGATDVYNRLKDKHYGEAALSAVGNAAGAAAPWLSGAVAAPLATIGGIAAPLYLGASDRLRHLEKHPEDYRLQEDEYDAMGNRQR